MQQTLLEAYKLLPTLSIDLDSSSTPLVLTKLCCIPNEETMVVFDSDLESLAVDTAHTLYFFELHSVSIAEAVPVVHIDQAIGVVRY